MAHFFPLQISSSSTTVKARNIQTTLKEFTTTVRTPTDDTKSGSKVSSTTLKRFSTMTTPKAYTKSGRTVSPAATSKGLSTTMKTAKVDTKRNSKVAPTTLREFVTSMKTPKDATIYNSQKDPTTFKEAITTMKAPKGDTNSSKKNNDQHKVLKKDSKSVDWHFPVGFVLGFFLCFVCIVLVLNCCYPRKPLECEYIDLACRIHHLHFIMKFCSAHVLCLVSHRCCFT